MWRTSPLPAKGPGLRVPILTGGERAAELSERLNGLGMNLTPVSEEIGRASATKLCRSIVIKGLEALLIDCAAAARRFGVDEDVFASLAATFPSIDFAALADLMAGRVAQHGLRRAAEMREAAEMLADAGFDPALSLAIAAAQERGAARGRDERRGDAGQDPLRPDAGRDLEGRLFPGEDLPPDREARDRLLLALMGSPDPRQVDGLGGAHPLTSKAAVVARAATPGAMSTSCSPRSASTSGGSTPRRTAATSWPGSVPSPSSAASSRRDRPVTRVHIRTINTGTIAERPSRRQGPCNYDGGARIDGVPGTAAPIAYRFPRCRRLRLRRPAADRLCC